MVITRLEVSSGPRCLLSGTSVNIQCVNFGLPRPEIVFFRGVLQITPGQGSFSNFERVPNKFDTIRLIEAQQTDGGQYVCEARRGSIELKQSRPVYLVFCSKCQVDYLHQLLYSLILRPCFSPPTWRGYEATQCVDYSPPTAAGTMFTFLLHSSSHHSEPTSTRY